MCENLHYESVYFKELHNQQEYYWPKIYRTGAALVSTITSSNTKLEKDNQYYIQIRHKDLFSHYNLILRKLYEKMSRKALENTNEMCSCPLGIL